MVRRLFGVSGVLFPIHMGLTGFGLNKECVVCVLCGHLSEHVYFEDSMFCGADDESTSTSTFLFSAKAGPFTRSQPYFWLALQSPAGSSGISPKLFSALPDGTQEGSEDRTEAQDVPAAAS